MVGKSTRDYHHRKYNACKVSSTDPGLTDVETSLTVVDTATGQVRRYDKPLGAGFDPIRDTSAFDTCP